MDMQCVLCETGSEVLSVDTLLTSKDLQQCRTCVSQQAILQSARSRALTPCKAALC
jgi:hypothetical protein